MRLGKLPAKELETLVLSRIPREDSSVLLWPKFGEDGAVVKTRGGEILVAVADPITGASRLAGWLSVIVNANDVAVHAAMPRWFLSIVMLPPEADFSQLNELMEGVLEGCKRIRCSLIGGHTEFTDRVTAPVISGFMIGQPLYDDFFLTSSGAKPGDDIIVTKGAGIEGTFILCTDFPELIANNLGESFLSKCRALQEKIPVVEDVIALGDILRELHAMHDVTEGGVLGGIFEVSYASDVGFEIDALRVPVLPETATLAELLKFDYLRLIGSGSIIIAAKPDVSEEVIKRLRKAGVVAEIVGKFVEKERGRKVIYDDKAVNLSEAPEDELWCLLTELSGKS